MTVELLDAHDSAPKIIGRGLLQTWDRDKLDHAIQRGAVSRFTKGDGSLGDVVRAVRYRHLPKSALLPRNLKATLSKDARPGLWVPAHEMHAAARTLRDRGLLPDEVRDGGENLFLTAGITRIWANFNAVPASTAVFDATHCRVGASDGSTAAAAGDTTLTGATNTYYQILDGAPSASTNQTSRTSTFPTTQGNFAWNSWGIDNGTASSATVTAPLVNHAVVSLGTKTSAAAWAFTVTHSIS